MGIKQIQRGSLGISRGDWESLELVRATWRYYGSVGVTVGQWESLWVNVGSVGLSGVQ